MFFTSIVMVAALAVPLEEKNISFVGFSGDESTAAWRVEVVRPHSDGSVDRFTLFRVVHVESNATVADYRQPGWQRTRDTKAVRCPPAQFADANPDWGGALEPRAWRRIRSLAGFSHRRIKMANAAIRLSGTHLPQTLERHLNALTLVGEFGQPMGFEPVVRLTGGRSMPLGFFHEPAVPHCRMQAEVTAYQSKTGRSIAILNRFDALDSDRPPSWIGRVAALPQRIGTSPHGTIRLGYARDRLVRETYLSLGAEYADVYDRFMGRW